MANTQDGRKNNAPSKEAQKKGGENSQGRNQNQGNSNRESR